MDGWMRWMEDKRQHIEWHQRGGGVVSSTGKRQRHSTRHTLFPINRKGNTDIDYSITILPSREIETYNAVYVTASN